MGNYFYKPRSTCRGCGRCLNREKMYSIQMPFCFSEMHVCIECFHSKPHLIIILQYPNRMAPPPLSKEAIGDVDENVIEVKQIDKSESEKKSLPTFIEKNDESGGEDSDVKGEEKFLKKAEKFLLKLFID